MSRRFLLAVLATAGLCVGAAGSSASDAAKDANARVVNVSVHDGAHANRRLTLALNKATVVQLDADARDVLVSNPEIVDAVVRTPRRIFLLAQKTGQTNAFFFDAAGHQILSLDIRVEKDTGDLGAMIHENIPGSDIHVSGLNDNVVLSGTVSSAQDSMRAQDLAARFAGGADKVVNMLKIGSGEQVMLRVRVAEMDRNIAKQFGINLAAAGTAAGVPWAVSTDDQFGLLGHALSDISGGQVGQVCQNLPNPLSGGACIPGPNNLQGALQALETVGLVHILAEPNLTAVSGETARFLAGGEFPVPAGRDTSGNVSVEFKEFGVGLSFTPVVLSAGRISLQISTEVSELTNTGALTLSGGTQLVNGQLVQTPGVTIPALSVRRAQTTVELPSGGSFAIAGLMQHTTKQVLEAFPGLKDMPVLGALFRSRDFQNDETELVVLVSAYLVNPTTQAKLAAPTDGYQAPTDPETILLGRLNAIYKRDSKPLEKTASGPVGYIVQ
ncbi:MAG TPA: type II and III secretion system protein family protein [Rhizomicrobium sp.]|nr:type II and III secretion system protein family protein [Rhizomicrobium sp.]